MVWRQAPGVGVPDGPQRRARHCAHLALSTRPAAAWLQRRGHPSGSRCPEAHAPTASPGGAHLGRRVPNEAAPRLHRPGTRRTRAVGTGGRAPVRKVAEGAEQVGLPSGGGQPSLEAPGIDPAPGGAKLPAESRLYLVTARNAWESMSRRVPSCAVPFRPIPHAPATWRGPPTSRRWAIPGCLAHRCRGRPERAARSRCRAPVLELLSRARRTATGGWVVRLTDALLDLDERFPEIGGRSTP